MPQTVFSVDLNKAPEDHAIKTHNRWHPDIPMVDHLKPGHTYRVECHDWTGGQIGNNDSANDVRDVDLTRVHYLSGPFGVALNLACALPKRPAGRRASSRLRLA